MRSCLACLRWLKRDEVENGGRERVKATALTSTISSKSSNLDRMADELVLRSEPRPTQETEAPLQIHWDKHRRRTLEALQRGNRVNDDCYKAREWRAVLQSFKAEHGGSSLNLAR